MGYAKVALIGIMRKIFGKQRALLGIATFLIVAGMLSLIVDVQAARLMDLNPIPKEIGRILRFSEIGGHGTGAAMVLIAVIASSQLRWRRSEGRIRALRLIAGTYLGGLFVDLFKLIIPRVRPGKAILENANGFFDTFGRQLLDAGIHGRSAVMSFPSGHAAVAAGLAASLWWYLPAGRPAFVALAILASLQRVATNNHYVSDIFIGAALGLVGAWLCMPKLQARDS
ncbi:phosphatase PAP2 family protein [Cyanobium sp. HWJ4-Hawea]|uniref:phosphatase PAP2 family protein n=1 Tax=Cyanobium sp. HWJ4-Hawea TaxID=2823713 RepID=UPI0020CB9B90|nr:phosphatase PAP2 family protein [Cyanobium sp. HWJ4-Hawea]MCP9810290.1 phosphatase PAP2 family protein [Cyanobium sp. HWJ4-Hawea]